MGEIRTPFEREWIFPLGTTHARGPRAAGPREHRQVPHRDVRPALAGARPGVQVRDAGVDAPPAQRLVPRHPGQARGRGTAPTPRTAEQPPAIEPSDVRRRWVRGRGGRRPRARRRHRLRPRRRRPLVRAAGRARRRARLRHPRQPAGRRARGGRGRATSSSARDEPAASCARCSPRAPASRTSPGRTVVTARHIADATDPVGPAHLWRACEMMLRGGRPAVRRVRWTGRGEDDPFARAQPPAHAAVRRVVARARGSGRDRRGAAGPGTRAPTSPRPGTGPDGWWSNGNAEESHQGARARRPPATSAAFRRRRAGRGHRRAARAGRRCSRTRCRSAASSTCGSPS